MSKPAAQLTHGITGDHVLNLYTQFEKHWFKHFSEMANCQSCLTVNNNLCTWHAPPPTCPKLYRANIYVMFVLKFGKIHIWRIWRVGAISYGESMHEVKLSIFVLYIFCCYRPHVSVVQCNVILSLHLNDLFT